MKTLLALLLVSGICLAADIEFKRLSPTFRVAYREETKEYVMQEMVCVLLPDGTWKREWRDYKAGK